MPAQRSYRTKTSPQLRKVRPVAYNDIELTKANVKRPVKKSASKGRPGPKSKSKGASLPAVPNGSNKSSSKAKGLSQLLSPKGIQDTLKTVGSLRTSVKQWLQYLQQADQVLDTLFITSSTLKETGVLEKIVKQKGKNLSTDDFTNILIALMNSPMGGTLLKSFGGSDSNSGSNETPG